MSLIIRRAFLIVFLCLWHDSIAAANDSSSSDSGLKGKVMCGYQAWFRCPSDGSRLGWKHYSNQKDFAPGKCTIELWPDVRELPAHARVKTPFIHPDGSVAEVYSSANKEAIDLHFKWMREYGIDGVFLQRFAVSTANPKLRKSLDQILVNCKASAEKNSRCWALMYDLSGLQAGQVNRVIDDWKHIHTRLSLGAASSTYLAHRSKPLIALWGMGFRDRKTSLTEWERLIKFLKSDPQYGGCSIMIGVPSFWRSLSRDSVDDPKLHQLIAMADVISPWTVGRYRSPEEAKAHTNNVVKADIQWCQKRQIDYLPVIFPGFSWQNLMSTRGKEAPFNHIPRKGGQFLWTQARHAHLAGAGMLYVAMFDELDEGTAIFKTRNDPPTGKNRFLAEQNLPSDHYLWLTGRIRHHIQPPAGTEPRVFPEKLPPRVNKQ